MKKFVSLSLLSYLVSLPLWAYDIQHLEPANWWVGMKRPQLQLMVHGEKISELSPQINAVGVQLVSVEKSDNPNYVFINLTIDANATATTFPIRFLKDGKTVLSHDYRLLNRRKDSALRQGFTSTDAIYLLVPDRFANGTTKNDSLDSLTEKVNRTIPGGRHGGDLLGMTQSLDYIKDLGFTMIWPTPLVENNMEHYSYHGYSATNHYQIDARFGSNQDYQQYVQRAKAKGMGVIQDIVLNHIGSGHWWMKDLPAKDWLNFNGKFTGTTHRRMTIHDPHAAPEDAKLFTDGWFVDSMPDLNQRNHFLATYLIQNSIWWIEYADLSGIREDTYSYSDKTFLANWGKAILEEYPAFNMVGEEWTSNQAIVASWQKGKRNDSGYVSWTPSLMDFPVHDAMRNGLVEAEGWSSGMMRIYETIANDFIYANPMDLVVFPENHDTSRLFSTLNEDIGLYKNALVLTATTRGIPQFFYGTEVLFTSPKERDDGVVRSDMLGGWRTDHVNAFTGKGLTAEQKDAQVFVKKLFNWRKNSAAATQGELLHYVPERSTYVYFRTKGADKVMVVLNKNTQDIQLDLTRYQGALQGKSSGINVLTGQTIDLTQPLQLTAKTPVIIQL